MSDFSGCCGKVTLVLQMKPSDIKIGQKVSFYSPYSGIKRVGYVKKTGIGKYKDFVEIDQVFYCAGFDVVWQIKPFTLQADWIEAILR